MKIKLKLVILELVTGFLGWVWVGASLVTVYFLVNVIAFHGQWSDVIWAAVVAGTAKWLTRGFMENQHRIAEESHLRSFTRRP